jgi:hypothetical protein
MGLLSIDDAADEPVLNFAFEGLRILSLDLLLV